MQRYHAAHNCSWPTLDGEFVRYDDAQVEIARLTAELDECKKAVNSAYVAMRNLANNLTAERDQALARAAEITSSATALAAAAAMEMRKRAAATYAMYSGVDLTKRLISLPIAPDAQKALDNLLSQAREDAIREAATAIYNKPQGICTEGAAHKLAQHVLALLNDGGRDEWQPIETAPMDGRHVLLWLREPYSRVELARWFAPWGTWTDDHPTATERDEGVYGIGSGVPTHWMPLPEPPKESE